MVLEWAFVAILLLRTVARVPKERPKDVTDSVESLLDDKNPIDPTSHSQTIYIGDVVSSVDR